MESYNVWLVRAVLLVVARGLREGTISQVDAAEQLEAIANRIRELS